MKSKSSFPPILTVLLFLAGIALQLSLSSGVVWAELEATAYGTQSDSAGLGLNCPVILSRMETGYVSTSVTNTIDQDVLPVVTAEISSADGMQSSSQTLSLAAHESQSLQWSVDATNIIFGRLILVNIIQRRYSDLDSHQSSCGILVLNFFNLSGKETLALIAFGSLASILIGGMLWRRIYAPLDEAGESTFRACATLSGVTTLALLTALPRWWGLTILLSVIALIMLVVIFTELRLFPKRARK